MSGRNPSLLALLGLAAVAGYQNRDALRGMIDRATRDRPPESLQERAATAADPWMAGTDPTPLPDRTEPDLMRSLRAGLGDLLRRFDLRGDDTTAQSWVGPGQNLTVTPDWLGTVLGDEMISELTEKTGLPRVALLARLSQVLPDTVDLLTPEGMVEQDESLIMAEPKMRRAV